MLRSRRHNLVVQTFYCPDCDAFFSGGGGGPVNYDDSDLIGYYLGYAEAIRSRHQKNFAFIGKNVRGCGRVGTSGSEMTSEKASMLGARARMMVVKYVSFGEIES